MNSITIFGLELSIDPIAFSIFGWDVYWYGVLIATGVILALIYGMKNGNRLGMNPDHIFNAFVIVLPVSVLAARAYYIIFDPASSFADFFDFSGHGFRGLAIYGGVIGAAITIFIMQRIYKFSFLAALDVTSIGFLIGQGIGRWGNFVNQEAYGTFTGSDWFGMTGNRIAAEMGSDALVHPCFLYESLWCIGGFFLLHFLSKRRRYKGQIALFYCAWYGAERAVVETLRTDSLMLGNSGIRVSSLLSAIICVAAITVLMVMRLRAKRRLEDAAYEGVFNDGFEELKGEQAEKVEAAPMENGEEPEAKDVEIDLSEQMAGGIKNDDN